MKTSTLLVVTAAVLFGLSLWSSGASAQIPIICVGEGCQGPEGPQGPQGPPGQDGQDGQDGQYGSPDTADQVREKFFTGTACPGNGPDETVPTT